MYGIYSNELSYIFDLLARNRTDSATAQYYTCLLYTSFNLSGVYHNQKEYEKEEYYLCLFLKNHTRQLLPFMFWYIHNQRLQGKGIEKVLAQSYDTVSYTHLVLLM